MKKEYLILVDNNDKQWGKLEKELAHKLGLLHRAFSIFIFNNKGELLLQQRADGKYHSPGLWTNTCCSHPQFGEELNDAVPRSLMEEMGMTSETVFRFNFIYKAKFENGLIEHEFDHVFFGLSDELPVPKESEVKDWKYISLDELAFEITLFPERYTEWLKICLTQVREQTALFLVEKTLQKAMKLSRL